MISKALEIKIFYNCMDFSYFKNQSELTFNYLEIFLFVCEMKYR